MELRRMGNVLTPHDGGVNTNGDNHEKKHQLAIKKIHQRAEKRYPPLAYFHVGCWLLLLSAFPYNSRCQHGYKRNKINKSRHYKTTPINSE